MKKYIVVKYREGSYEDIEIIIESILIVEDNITTDQIDTYVKNHCGENSSWEFVENVKELVLEPVIVLVDKK